MTKLDPEIREKINHFLDQGYINESQAKMLKAYFKYDGNHEEAAKAIKIKKGL